MNDVMLRPDDASAPQAAGVARFSWSGFCKTGIVHGYASVLEHACEKLWVHPEHNRCPAISSRRIQWRNSLSFQRSWCPSFRPPAHARHPSPLSSRSTRRSMSSRRLAKASITDLISGQCTCAAPALQTAGHPPTRLQPLQFRCSFRFSLWSISLCSATLSVRFAAMRQGAEQPGPHALSDLSAPLVYRRSRCPNLPLLWSLARPSQFRPAPAKHPHLSPSWRPRSWSSPSLAKASTAKNSRGRAPVPGPTPRAAAPQIRRCIC